MSGGLDSLDGEVPPEAVGGTTSRVDGGQESWRGSDWDSGWSGWGWYPYWRWGTHNWNRTYVTGYAGVGSSDSRDGNSSQQTDTGMAPDPTAQQVGQTDPAQVPPTAAAVHAPSTTTAATATFSGAQSDPLSSWDPWQTSWNSRQAWQSSWNDSWRNSFKPDFTDPPA